LTELII